MNNTAHIEGEDYKLQLLKDFRHLLDTEGSDEKKFQEFMEKNPVLVPGAGMTVGETGHVPYLNVLISQPALHGLFKKVPDFLWLSENSLVFNPVFIEIEAPDKKIFTKAGDFHADFTHAKAQLAEWRGILKQPQNLSKFYDEFDLPRDFTKKTFKPSFVLIYGRRSEIANETFLKHKLNEFMEGFELMSYDRLFELPSMNKGAWATTVTVTGGKYIPKYVSPLTYVSDAFLELYEALPNLDVAIDNSMYITHERKEFMKRRIKEIMNSPKNEPKNGVLQTFSPGQFKLE